MLDTVMARNPLLCSLQSRAAKLMHSAGVRARQATIAGAVAGLLSAFAFASGRTGVGLAALWISAAADALDGSIARQFEHPTVQGGILDLTSDRVVEAAVLLGVAWPRPYMHFAALVLLASWYINITIFLSVGAALGPSEKLIRYPPGLLERTEGLVFLSVLAFAGRMGIYLCYAYALLEIWTALQRLRFAQNQLR